jgi:ankyrin repeat protein
MLHWAAFADLDAETMSELIVAGNLQLEATDGDGRTPLTVAAWQKKEIACKALIEIGSSIAEALPWLKSRDEVDGVRLLIRLGVTDATQMDANEFLEGIQSIEMLDCIVTETVLRGWTQVALTMKPDQSLYFVAKVGDDQITLVNDLAKACSEKKVLRFDHLKQALESDQLRTVECIYQNLPKERQADEKGQNSLMWAVSLNAIRSVRILLDLCRVDPNYPIPSDGVTALMIACESRHPQFVRILVQEYGAKVNTRDSHGRTALHYAVYFNCFEAAEDLLRLGCDKSIRATPHLGNVTALELARQFPDRGAFIKLLSP